jgi:hypothetical protein
MVRWRSIVVSLQRLDHPIAIGCSQWAGNGMAGVLGYGACN